MSNKIILLVVLLVTAVFISGCIYGNGDEPAPNNDLPDGFTYLGTHETYVEIGDTNMAAVEDIYRNKIGEDIYVQVIESDNPDGLITMFKSHYKDANYEPFKDIRFNGHIATQVKDYTVINGTQEPRYTIIWATENSLMIVGSSKNEKDVLDMAIATGS